MKTFPLPTLEIHEHYVTSVRRAARVGANKFNHSHLGGSTPHRHPETGPSFYGYRKPKTTSKPKGEQLETIALSEDDASFDLIVTDSAITYESGKAVPIGNRSLESLGFSAAERMIAGSRLKCIVHDERNKKT